MTLAPADLLALALACAPNVAPGTLQSIVHVESHGDPLAIGVNRGAARARKARDLADAIAIARELRRKGANFDAGLMQINSANWPRLGLTAENVFDPCTNLRAGARILTGNYAAAARRYGAGRNALLVALSLYNTGNHHAGFSNGYVAKVASVADRPHGPAPAPRSPIANPPWGLPSAGVAPAREWAAASSWGESSIPAAPSAPTRHEDAH